MTGIVAAGSGDEWEWALGAFDEVLEDIGDVSGEPWDPWSLATCLDVPSFAIAELIPQVRATGVVEGFDFVEKVRTGVAGAMVRLRERGADEADRPLPLEFGLTKALLEWEWAEMVAAGEKPYTFFERLRELRLRLPEVSLCERTVHRFCERVPPPWIGP